jgi:hypothetical protein
METVFVFNGVGRWFPSAIFTTKEAGEKWIEEKGLSGTLTQMPVNISAYDHAIESGLFTPQKNEFTPEFIGAFSSRLWHGHYEEGKAQ